VTLDDVLDHLAASKTRCFATYDECAALADKARKLRRSLEDLAEDLRERNDLIGRLTARAMDQLAESMDVVARKAEEKRGKSQEAAESVESAHDAMHDAYRPVQDATAAAGLVMPSARIHNDD
jgi:methyl-accepting chemotaxis protein